MFYVTNRKDGQGNTYVCICKANSAEKARLMSGIHEEDTHWVCFTEEQVRVLLESIEGHIVKKM